MAPAGDERSEGVERVLELFRPPDAGAGTPPLDRSDLPPGVRLLLDVSVTVGVDLGQVDMELGDILGLGRSALVMLDHPVDQPVLIRVNGVPFARGEVVEVEGRYGVRVTEILPPPSADRPPAAGEGEPLG